MGSAYNLQKCIRNLTLDKAQELFLYELYK